MSNCIFTSLSQNRVSERNTVQLKEEVHYFKPDRFVLKMSSERLVVKEIYNKMTCSVIVYMG